VQLDNTVEVETPEHLGLRFHVAGPTRRGWAYLIDLLLRLAALVLFEMVSVLATGSSLHWPRRLASGVTLLALFVVEWGYFVLFETVGNGRTPGKRLLRLRVVREDGYPLSFADAVLRNLLRAADFLPVGYLLGLVVMSWNVRFARLGDRAAGTMVVSEDAAKAVPVVAIDPQPTAAELGQLAHALSPSVAERNAIELLLGRRDLSPARRRELADMLAPCLAAPRSGKPGPEPDDPVRFLALVHLTSSRSPARFGEDVARPRWERARS